MGLCLGIEMKTTMFSWSCELLTATLVFHAMSLMQSLHVSFLHFPSSLFPCAAFNFLSISVM
ncbi:hypothetical protein HanPSC8_Chr03g0089641 [Helianthus annuus]|nr:hypothetical protein HanPSC8_Chr03g0089641 [Helianthus annuus]